MSGVDTALSGDPAGCLAAARVLDRRAGALEVATDALTHHTALDGDLAGVAGDAYRARARDLAGSCAALAGHHRAVASALVRFGDDLARVADQLARCRAVARQELVLRGDLVVEPGAYATPAQRTTYQQLSREIASARAAEDGAHFAWQSALAEHTDTPSPAPPWGSGAPVGPVPPPSLLAPPSPGAHPGSEPGLGREPGTEPGREPAREPGREPAREPGRAPAPALGPPGVDADAPGGEAGATAGAAGSTPDHTPTDSPGQSGQTTTCAGAPPPDRGPGTTSATQHHVLIGPEVEHTIWHARDAEADDVVDPPADRAS